MSKETKRKKQKSFFDEENRRAELAKHRDPLKRLNAVLQWELFRTSFAKATEGTHLAFIHGFTPVAFCEGG